MADEAVTATALASAVAGADMLTAAGNTVEVDAANVGVITTGPGGGRKGVLILYENGGGAATATVAAGADPPSLRAGIGALEISVPSGDCIATVLETARFLQANGTIRVTVATNNVHMTWLEIPDTV